MYLVSFFLSGKDESEDINMREMSLNDHVCRASAHRSLNISEITEQFATHVILNMARPYIHACAM